MIGTSIGHCRISLSNELVFEWYVPQLECTLHNLYLRDYQVRSAFIHPAASQP